MGHGLEPRPQFHEKTPRERSKNEICGGRWKNAKCWASHPSGNHPPFGILVFVFFVFFCTSFYFSRFFQNMFVFSSIFCFIILLFFSQFFQFFMICFFNFLIFSSLEEVCHPSKPLLPPPTPLNRCRRSGSAPRERCDEEPQ